MPQQEDKASRKALKAQLDASLKVVELDLPEYLREREDSEND